VIGYPLGYHGSTLRGEMSSDRDIVGVLGVKRIIASTSETKDNQHGVVTFSIPSGDIVKTYNNNTTRALTRSIIPSDFVAKPRMFAALIWEPAAFAGATGDFATITRPDGYVIRMVGEYIREVSISSGVLNTNVFATSGLLEENGSEIRAALYYLEEMNDGITPSEVAKELWLGEPIIPGDPTSPRRIRSTLIKWGRQAYRYARYIEMVTRGKRDYVNRTNAEIAKLSGTEKIELQRRVTIVGSACVNLWNGVRQILTNGIMPYWLPHTESLLGTPVTGDAIPPINPSRVSNFKTVYDGSSTTAELDADTNSFLTELANWQQLRYDRTMCADPRGVRPVWGGVTTRVAHEARRWGVIVDTAVGDDLGRPQLADASANVYVGAQYTYVPVRQFSDLDPPVDPVDNQTVTQGLDFRIPDGEGFSYYNNHHTVYGYILYLITIILRYYATAQIVVEGQVREIRQDVEYMLTVNKITNCGSGQPDPFPLLLMLLDFLAPLSESDVNDALGVPKTDIHHRRRMLDAIQSGATPGELAALAIPDALCRGIRAPPSLDQIRRPFPPIRDFDLYQGHSWNVGPTLEFDGHMQEAPTESALAYYAAYHFLNEVRSNSNSSTIVESLMGIFLKNNASITTDPRHDKYTPYTAIVALSHELASARSLRSTDSNKTMSDRSKEETFGSKDVVPTLTNSLGGYPVFADWKLLEALARGFVTSVDSTGVSRRVRFEPLSRRWKRLPFSMPYHVATQCVPLVPGVSAPIPGGINDHEWARFIMNISAVGGIMRPHNTGIANNNGVEVERYTYNVGLNRTKASVISDYIFRGLSELLLPEPFNYTNYGNMETMKTRQNGLGFYAPSADMVAAFKQLCVAMLHLNAGRITAVGTTVGDIVFASPVFPMFNLEDNFKAVNLIHQSSWEEILAWYKAYKDRIYPADAKPNTVTAYSTNAYYDDDSRTPIPYYNAAIQEPYLSLGLPVVPLTHGQYPHYNPSIDAASKAFFGMPASTLTIKP
jgi:hypothetical protein